LSSQLRPGRSPYVGGLHEESLELADRAVHLQPNSFYVRHHCGAAYAFGGESDKAIEHFHAARRLNPIAPRKGQVFQGLAVAHFFLREFEEAVAWGHRALAQSPTSNSIRRFLAAGLAHLGRIDEARTLIADVLASQPNSNLTRSRKTSFRYPWMMDLYIEGLRKAGLPE